MVDLDLLHTTLDDLGQPAFRARQVWEWAARGAAGYEAMTNVPAGLRDALADRVPFSTLTLADQAESGLAAVGDHASPATERLRDMAGFYRFLQGRLPELIEEWEAVRAAREA